ncbi:AbrB/MazE/SpoVT family DNA-binding domain-containing protein [Thiorhodovibrio frisius]|uniref:Looped-hinge helix DNA binding domain, AbrB family n=1 Tax=Thiorhodovibrio frisius TaxID=631362 RepID=H8Z1W9_9GAMM|nr:AbrB/MazE/SpoVT family DNA-binding domain-containing protein [Thiorhodovibrio frisius]EIC22597.1 looped-hinge helix DNA binding domain, AbrB family [Thiorhodovibrio frisius]WPL20038.1 transcriptional regulator, AbrB family [Thiorhodovibrio frisius]
MSTVTVTLSNDGQIFIPKPIRDQLHWEGGRALILETTATGISLRIHPANQPQRLESLRGFLKQDRFPLSTEELCAPVDVTTDWDAAEQRNQ